MYGFLAEHGLEIEVVDRDRLVEIEPGLAAARDGIAGAVYSPMDQTGNSRHVRRALAAMPAKGSASSSCSAPPSKDLLVEGDRVAGVRTSAGRLEADAVVIAMGPESGLLGRRNGIDLPVYPVKGYTATVPLNDPAKGPTMGGVDEDQMIAYSRLGDRLRLAFHRRVRRLRPQPPTRRFASACSTPRRSCFPAPSIRPGRRSGPGSGR